MPVTTAPRADAVLVTTSPWMRKAELLEPPPLVVSNDSYEDLMELDRSPALELGVSQGARSTVRASDTLALESVSIRSTTVGKYAAATSTMSSPRASPKGRCPDNPFQAVLDSQAASGKIRAVRFEKEQVRQRSRALEHTFNGSRAADGWAKVRVKVQQLSTARKINLVLTSLLSSHTQRDLDAEVEDKDIAKKDSTGKRLIKDASEGMLVLARAMGLRRRTRSEANSRDYDSDDSGEEESDDAAEERERAMKAAIAKAKLKSATNRFSILRKLGFGSNGTAYSITTAKSFTHAITGMLKGKKATDKKQQEKAVVWMQFTPAVDKIDEPDYLEGSILSPESPSWRLLGTAGSDHGSQSDDESVTRPSATFSDDFDGSFWTALSSHSNMKTLSHHLSKSASSWFRDPTGRLSSNLAMTAVAAKTSKRRHSSKLRNGQGPPLGPVEGGELQPMWRVRTSTRDYSDTEDSVRRPGELRLTSDSMDIRTVGSLPRSARSVSVEGQNTPRSPRRGSRRGSVKLLSPLSRAAEEILGVSKRAAFVDEAAAEPRVSALIAGPKTPRPSSRPSSRRSSAVGAPLEEALPDLATFSNADKAKVAGLQAAFRRKLETRRASAVTPEPTALAMPLAAASPVLVVESTIAPASARTARDVAATPSAVQLGSQSQSQSQSQSESIDSRSRQAAAEGSAARATSRGSRSPTRATRDRSGDAAGARTANVEELIQNLARSKGNMSEGELRHLLTLTTAQLLLFLLSPDDRLHSQVRGMLDSLSGTLPSTQPDSQRIDAASTGALTDLHSHTLTDFADDQSSVASSAGDGLDVHPPAFSALDPTKTTRRHAAPPLERPPFQLFTTTGQQITAGTRRKVTTRQVCSHVPERLSQTSIASSRPSDCAERPAPAPPSTSSSDAGASTLSPGAPAQGVALTLPKMAVDAARALVGPETRGRAQSRGESEAGADSSPFDEQEESRVSWAGETGHASHASADGMSSRYAPPRVSFTAAATTSSSASIASSSAKPELGASQPRSRAALAQVELSATALAARNLHSLTALGLNEPDMFTIVEEASVDLQSEALMRSTSQASCVQGSRGSTHVTQWSTGSHAKVVDIGRMPMSPAGGHSLSRFGPGSAHGSTTMLQNIDELSALRPGAIDKVASLPHDSAPVAASNSAAPARRAVLNKPVEEAPKRSLDGVSAGGQRGDRVSGDGPGRSSMSTSPQDDASVSQGDQSPVQERPLAPKQLRPIATARPVAAARAPIDESVQMGDYRGRLDATGEFILEESDDDAEAGRAPVAAGVRPSGAYVGSVDEATGEFVLDSSDGSEAAAAGLQKKRPWWKMG